LSSARRGSTQCAYYPFTFGGWAPPSPPTPTVKAAMGATEEGLVLEMLSSGATPVRATREGRGGEVKD
jgi:hypothetical protein